MLKGYAPFVSSLHPNPSVNEVKHKQLLEDCVDVVDVVLIVTQGRESFAFLDECQAAFVADVVNENR